MNRNIILTCAVTGGADHAHKSPHVPVTPKEIAQASIDAAKAGAAIAHIHVRDPKTGKPSRKVEYYQEVVERIREADTDVIINLTTGMGGDIFFGPDSNPLELTSDTDFMGQKKRMPHVEMLLPEVATLDCGSFNCGPDNYTYISTPDMLKVGLESMKKHKVKPELEVFDLGHLWLAKSLAEQGYVDDPLYQICLGIRWAAEATPSAFKAFVEHLPKDAKFAGFGLGAMQMPMVAQSALLGGHARVGLEDNLFLAKGQLATNAQLVERAASILTNMGSRLQSPAEARESLGLIKQEQKIALRKIS